MEQVPVNLGQRKKHLCPVCGRTAMGDGEYYYCPVCPNYVVEERLEEMKRELMATIKDLTLL